MALATNTSPGEIQLAGDLGGNNDATAPALSSTGVTPGEYIIVNINVDAKGRLTAAAEASSSQLISRIGNATTSTKGVVQIGDNLIIQSGVLSAPLATTSSVGVVQIGSGLLVDGNGVVDVDTSEFTPATETELGLVKVPASGNLDVDGSGNLTVPSAQPYTGSPATLGVVTVVENDGLTMSEPGVLTLNLPVADGSTLGIVKAGTNVDITGGVLSVTFDCETFPIATSTVVGTVKVPGGDGLSVAGDGTLSFTASPATTSTLGGVIVGTGLTVDGSGNLSAALADSTGSPQIPGVVYSGNTDNITLTTGLLDLGTNIPRKDTPNTYTAANSVSTSTLSDGANISVDASLSNVFEVTLGGNRVLDNPTNLVAGGTYLFIIKQDGVGSRSLTFGSAYKFRSGITPTQTDDPNAVDLMSCVSDGTNLYCAYNRDFL